MPKHVIGNVVDSRLLVGNKVVEDVQNVKPPDVEKMKTEIDAMGLAGKFDMANPTRYEKMTVTIEHNKGTNFQLLRGTGVLKVECRLASQQYTVSKATMGYVGAKYRFHLQHSSTKAGDIKRDSPQSVTEEYSCLRYEEIVDGKVITLIDLLTNEVVLNGVNQTDALKAMLD